MPPVQLTLLGTFQVSVEGQRRALATRKCEALLAYLAMRGDQVHRRDALAVLLWGDVAPAQARHSLRQTLWRIRDGLSSPAPVLLTDGDTIGVDRNVVDVDAVAFQRLAASPKAEDLAAAAALYGGPFLDGLQVNEQRFDNWQAGERTRLHHVAIQVLTARMNVAVAARETDEAMKFASALLALDQTQEHVHRLLMRLYREQGQFAAALQQYNLCGRVLQQELGVEPDAETRQLCQEILVQRARGHAVQPHAPTPATQQNDDPSPAPAVLILEPQPVTRVMIERVLRNAGYVVVLGKSPSAVPGTGEVKYSAIISGLTSSSARVQLLARLRARGYAGFVLFLTGDPHWPSEESGGLRVGYLRRPIRPRALVQTLRDALEAPAGQVSP
jgi:DNA-binding SARP family transcriptional activator/CheY-like chemotaxis protein